jgi:LPS export ABC transporter protein LptC
MIKFYEILKEKLHFNKIRNSIATTFMVVVVLFFMFSCSKEKVEQIGAIKNRSAMAQLHATEITTIVSDSGVTRYRISAPRWDVFDKAEKPYWNFPNGIHFEKFDMNLKVDANIHSRYARYEVNEKRWELRGKVRATNLQGELFETEQLFWSERESRIYSDSLIKITQVSHIITGIGFESDASMTRYTIRKPQGIFPVDRAAGTTPPATTTGSAASVAVPTGITPPPRQPIPAPVPVTKTKK